MLFADPVHPYGSFWADIADKTIKGLAVVIAGVWTYRESFRRKIEASVSGEIFIRDGQRYIILNADLKNLGKSRYTIRQTGTYVGAEAIDALGEKTSVVAASIFEDHAWIEPEEHIQDCVVRVLDLPVSGVAVKLNLRVVSRRFFRALEWNATRVLTLEH